MIDYGVLKTELLTDPNGYGYADPLAARTDWQVAKLLNRKRSSISMPRPDVTPIEIIEAIDVNHFKTNLTVLHGSWFESLTQLPSIRILKDNGNDTRVMTNLMTILTNGSTSESRLRALAVREGSRAEQLFGVDSYIQPSDIELALKA